MSVAFSGSLPAIRVQTGLGAVLQYSRHSNTPSLRSPVFEDDDEDENEYEARFGFIGYKQF